MTYLQFHLVFVLPPLLLLAWSGRRLWRNLPARAGRSLVWMALIALLYTTPWDNYLVWRGVWSYGPERVLGTWGYVPVEEYLFFVLQPLLTGLWLYRVLATSSGTRPRREGGGSHRFRGGLGYAALSLLGVWALQSPEGVYLGLILVWAGPVLALQWGVAGEEIWARRDAWSLGVVAPTLYLWFADWMAIRLGIWHISETHTLGARLGTLPLEEAVFFLTTNLLVVQGLLLFLYPPRISFPGKSAARRPPADLSASGLEDDA